MKKIFLFLTIVQCFAAQGQTIPGQNPFDPDALRYPHLVKEFYHRKHLTLFWFAPGSAARKLREQLWQCIDSARYSGLDSHRYHYAAIRDNQPGIHAPIADSAARYRLDRLYTDAALTLCRDLSQGKDIYDRLRYDELSARSAGAGDQQLLDQLITVNSASGLSQLITQLEPRTKEYLALKQALAAQLDSNIHPQEIKMLASSLDYYRWIHHFALRQYILVNIPSATLTYYTDDTPRLIMKIIAGNPSTPTLRFSARCTRITLYPYWNVPRHVTLTQLLPLFKASPALVDQMGMQLISPDGNIIDHHGLPWATFSEANFPYHLRQVTGYNNALGLIQFDVTDPFNISLHDTNLRSGFASNSRYYSHGGIRLEKAGLLAKELLGHQFDTTLLTQCRKDQQPIRLTLDKPIPVLVVYITAETEENGQITWYKDPYHLLTKK